MTEQALDRQSLQSRLLADLVQAMTAGHLLQASAVAVLVGRSAHELEQQALAGKTYRDREVDQLVQLHLRHVVTVLSVARRHFGGVTAAVHWYRSEPVAADARQTPEALTAEGRLEDAYRLLLRTPRTAR